MNYQTVYRVIADIDTPSFIEELNIASEECPNGYFPTKAKAVEAKIIALKEIIKSATVIQAYLNPIVHEISSYLDQDDREEIFQRMGISSPPPKRIFSQIDVDSNLATVDVYEKEDCGLVVKLNGVYSLSQLKELVETAGSRLKDKDASS